MLVDTLKELYDIFDLLNKEYYKGALPIPIITIQSGSKKKARGWFTVDPVWKDKANYPNGYEKHEINISAEIIGDPAIDVIATLQHEIVHYINRIEDIKDTDVSGTYHNKRFKERAEKLDLIVEKGELHGYFKTHCSEKLVTFIQEVIKPKSVFQWFREVPMKKPRATRKKSIFKYTCSKCGLEAKGKEGIKILCDECKVLLQMEDVNG